jgi:DNA-binding MarR family transcriptional regulator
MNDGTEVAERLHAVVHRMKRRLHQAMNEGNEALAPMEWRALGFFARHPGSTARDLVEHAGRDKAQVARLVRQLVDHGLLAAAPAPHDQRCVELRLTAAGQQVERRAARQRQRIEAQMLAGFSAAERAQFGAYLQRMRDALGEP